MRDSRIDRRWAIPTGVVADSRRKRRIFGLIAPALITLFWAMAAMAAGGLGFSRLDDDIAVTKATISLLAAKDFSAVRERLDPKMGPVSDDTLRQMSDAIGPNEPVSIATISSKGGYSFQAGDGNGRIVLEYAMPGKWVVVDAVVNTKDGIKRLPRLHLTVNGLPLSELNAFHLLGKGPVQYLFLACWIAVIVVTARAIVIAFKRHKGWRRWVLIALMPLGLTPTLAVNWNTAQLSVLETANNAAVSFIPVFALRWPMAMFGTDETLVPYLYVSAPLIAFGYLIWHRVRRQSRADGLAAP